MSSGDCLDEDRPDEYNVKVTLERNDAFGGIEVQVNVALSGGIEYPSLNDGKRKLLSLMKPSVQKGPGTKNMWQFSKQEFICVLC